MIPVSPFNGTKKGPIVGIIDGVHGYEYPPIVAAQQFVQTLDPTQLSGTVIQHAASQQRSKVVQHRARRVVLASDGAGWNKLAYHLR